MPTYTFTAELWQYPGYAAWYFITLPKDISDEIKMVRANVPQRGFGSIKVLAKIGNSAWSTSIFPDKTTACFLLPVKKQIRTAENIVAGDSVAIEITLR